MTLFISWLNKIFAWPLAKNADRNATAIKVFLKTTAVKGGSFDRPVFAKIGASPQHNITIRA
jgi:hypothetical protein